MALSIKNPEAEKLVREVTRITGESKTKAIILALSERLERVRGRRTVPDTFEVIMEVSRRCSSLPDLDTRTPEEILGYEDTGVFG
ncbi:unnamed protein product [marine sediment metagenome]|uniref:PSK operon transcription factor n=1 Tax=marine sediment metagenome TaxID=412755 RepID=X1IET0_9ZZZZ